MNRIIHFEIPVNDSEKMIEKRTITGLGYQAYGKDIEGTLFGLMQEDADAK